jgi:cysteine-rich repeat protein
VTAPLLTQSGCTYEFFSGPPGGQDGSIDSATPDGAESDGQPTDAATHDADTLDGAQPVCGNGAVEQGEECDDGNTTDGDGCSAYCEVESPCGNGVLDPGEQCDDGNRDNTDSCPDDGDDGGTCEPAFCGDGFIWAGHETCDGSNLAHETCQRRGYLSGTLTCGGDCAFDLSGCSEPGWYLFEDFETSSVNDWIFNDDWQVGTPTAQGEPDGAHSGVQCAGTSIGGTYTNDNTWAGTSLVSPAVDLSGATAPTLVFWHFIDAEYHCDGGNVWISTDGGSNWSVLDNTLIEPDYHDDHVGGIDHQPAYSGNHSSLGWHEVTADLSGYVGETILLRFSFFSDGSVTEPGWYIDDVVVTEQMLIPVELNTPASLGTAATGAPFSRLVQATGGSGSYHWTIEGGANHGWLEIEWTTGRLFGTPTPSDSGPVEVTVRAEDASLPGNYKQQTFVIEVTGAQSVPVEWDLEGSLPQGWLLSGNWQHGTPSGGGGPAGCMDGSGCIGTVLDGDYSLGLTFDGCSAMLPPITLAGTTQPTLVFHHFKITHPGDGGNIQISTDGGATFQVLGDPVPPYTGTAGGQAAYSDMDYGYTAEWSRVIVDLSDYVGQTVVLRFSFHSESASWPAPGWFIDQVGVYEAEDVAWMIEEETNLGYIGLGESFSKSVHAVGGSGAGEWTIEGGTNHDWLSIGSTDGVLSGVPDASNQGPGSVVVRVTEPANPQNYAEQTFTFEVVDMIMSASFDGSQPAGWALHSDWEWGTPVQYMMEPEACHSGDCVGTDMTGEHGNNRDYATCYAQTPEIDLTTATAPTLSFYQYVNTEPDTDGGNIQISIAGSTTWDVAQNSVVEPDYYSSSVGGLPAYSGYMIAEGWHPVTVDLSGYVGEVILIRFAFYATNFNSSTGWYIDDVAVFD